MHTGGSARLGGLSLVRGTALRRERAVPAAERVVPGAGRRRRHGRRRTRGG